MKQVKVLSDGRSVYIDAPVRRETKIETFSRRVARLSENVEVSRALKPGKAKFVRDPCIR